ncbi:MAG TPA: hypothetical protein VFM61_05130 [Pseudidiomarina sp.]|nr:hypothetical protein [Pseudidiomarina sp.]
MKKILSMTSVAISALLLFACSEKHTDTREPAAEQEQIVDAEAMAIENMDAEQAGAKLAEMNNAIRSMVGVAAATNLSQCRMLEVGARPCGGPEYYIAYSTENVDPETIETMAEEYTELRRWLNEEQQMMGTCEVIPEPKLSLQGGVCRALPTETM